MIDERPDNGGCDGVGDSDRSDILPETAQVLAELVEYSGVATDLSAFSCNPYL